MGLDIITFWELTPYELRLWLDSYYRRQKYDQEDKITLAYMTALWAAQWWDKRKPDPLDKILGRQEDPQGMSDKQMFEIVKKLNAAMGGEVIGSR